MGKQDQEGACPPEHSMGRKALDRMRNPFYAGLMFRIEELIFMVDEEAAEQGIELTDSQIRSTLIKACKMVQGADPVLDPTSDREKILADLAMHIYHAPDHITEGTADSDGERPLEISHWVNALESVQASIDVRRSTLPGSRGYLRFLRDFMAQARGKR
jgi:hypothetical protein